MILIQIRDYLQLVGRATLQDLVRHFKMQEGAIEQMLLFWVKKGCVRQSVKAFECATNTCHHCPFHSLPSEQIYIWQDSLEANRSSRKRN